MRGICASWDMSHGALQAETVACRVRGWQASCEQHMLPALCIPSAPHPAWPSGIAVRHVRARVLSVAGTMMLHVHVLPCEGSRKPSTGLGVVGACWHAMLWHAGGLGEDPGVCTGGRLWSKLPLAALLG